MGVEGETHILLLYLSLGAKCDEVQIQSVPLAQQQQNSSISRDPAQGSASLWPKMDPNLRHKDWVRAAGGITFPWESALAFSVPCNHALASLLPIFLLPHLLVLSPFLSSYHPPFTHFSYYSWHKELLDFFFWLMWSLSVIIILLGRQLCTHF